MKKIKWHQILFSMLLFWSVGENNSFAQVTPLPIAQVDSRMAINPRPMLILLSTDWCKYCQLQKAQLRKNNDFKNRASEFYYVEFNAEGKDPVNFHGNTYDFKPSGISSGIHELAIALNGGEEHLSFPTWIVLDSEYQVLFKHNGVLSAKQLKEVLNALGAEEIQIFTKKTTTY